jgi:predicted phosphodiesterase
MKIAVFSDVQGNLPAMESAVDHIRAWCPDLVILNGDLVNRGPSSAECLNLFEELRNGAGWLPVRGNHEDYILHCGTNPPVSELDASLRRFADWTTQQLGPLAELLRSWPDHLCLHGPSDDWVHVTHGSLAGNRSGISERIPDQDLPHRVPDDVDLFVVAHTHKPLEREFRGVRILNVGSVGSPFDGDPRSCYGRIEHRNSGWKTELVRVEYDRERTERDFRQSGFLDQGGPMASVIFEEWRRARMLMPTFKARYRKPLLEGEIGLQQAVEELLGDLD